MNQTKKYTEGTRNNFVPWRIVKGARTTNQEPRFLLNNVPFLSRFPTEMVLLGKIFLYGGRSIFWYLPFFIFSLISLCNCSSFFYQEKHNYPFCLFNSNMFKQIFEKTLFILIFIDLFNIFSKQTNSFLLLYSELKIFEKITQCNRIDS